THCAYGLCQYDCRERSDCDDGWCDALGQCRDKNDRAATPPVQTANEGRLTVSNPQLTIYSWSPQGEIEVSAERGALDKVRVVAPEGAQVNCGEGFTQSCELPALASGARAKVAVKVNTDALASDASSWAINLHARRQLQVVGVSLKEAEGGITAPTGRYEGHIWLSKTRADLLGDTPLKIHAVDTRAALFAVPVQLKIYADNTLVITDKRQMLPRSSDDVGMVFKLRPDDTFDAMVDSINRSRQLYFGGAINEDDTTAPEISVLASGKITATKASLSGTLELVLGGMGDTFFATINIDERPRVAWQFHVKRQGNIIEGDSAPALGSAPTPIFASTADRDAHQLPWEAQVRACGVFGGADRLSQLGHYLCYNHPGDLTSVDLAPAAGATPRPTLFPLFTAAERSVTQTPKALLEGCIKDLQRVHGPISGDPASCDATSLDQLSGCGPPRPGRHRLRARLCLTAGPTRPAALARGLRRCHQAHPPHDPAMVAGAHLRGTRSHAAKQRLFGQGHERPDARPRPLVEGLGCLLPPQARLALDALPRQRARRT
ncbi:MAG: hypothetical protein JRH20_28255, partial [Deltaproteobacteria bacterium]|nr:hypothetical protein [Deltaproteobacteria bacterium]